MLKHTTQNFGLLIVLCRHPNYLPTYMEGTYVYMLTNKSKVSLRKPQDLLHPSIFKICVNRQCWYLASAKNMQLLTITHESLIQKVTVFTRTIESTFCVDTVVFTAAISKITFSNVWKIDCLTVNPLINVSAWTDRFLLWVVPSAVRTFQSRQCIEKGRQRKTTFTMLLMAEYMKSWKVGGACSMSGWRNRLWSRL